MSSADLIAKTVMDAAGALLNDPAVSTYTYTKQIPYLNLSLQSLQELFELNAVPVVDTFTSSPILITAGVDHIAYNAIAPAPSLPNDFIEPRVLWERTTGINPFVPMTKVDYLPRWMEGTEITQFQYYTWQDQEIRFFAANQNNDIKMDYVRSLFTPVVDQNSTINVVNAESYLEFKTASLCARFIGQNKTRADELEGEAISAMDRALGIGTKGRQSIITRHRPFRSSFKRRSFM